MMWLACFILFFLAVRLMVAALNVATARKKYRPVLKGRPLLSVLVPARNEALNIGRLIQSIENQEYKNYELLIYDDQSDDKTGEIVESFAKNNPKIRLIRGKTLPEGWLGKNHACHCLASESKGEYLLFLDADVEVGIHLFDESINYLNEKEIQLLSIFPQQVMLSMAEKLTVPLMNWILVSLLPLVMTRFSSWKSFSAANGQFMLFDAKIYREHFFHSFVKLNAVEDIQIFRMMKKMKYRTETLLSNGQIKCRMYNGFSQAVEGFSKNIPAFFGGSVLFTLAFTLITTFGWAIVLIYMSLYVFIIFAAGTLFLRVLVSWASRQNCYENVLYAPLQQLVFAYIAFRSLMIKKTGQIVWKGRTYHP